MREARIILPNRRSNCHKLLGRMLANEFGGFTRLAGHGHWVDPRGEDCVEDVFIYHVAVPSCSVTVLRRLWNIAREIGHIAKQQCIYLVMPTGSVFLVEPDAEFDARPGEG